MAAIVRKRRPRNPSALGWTGIAIGAVALVAVTGAGVILYRMMKM